MPSGSALPGGRSAHVPWLPLTPQLWHDGHDAEPQQNPSMQLPLAHWPSLVQLAPSARLPMHPPLLQNEPAAH